MWPPFLVCFCRSDSGGASFLGEVVEAVREMVVAQQWQLESVPRLHVSHEVALAEAQGSDLPAVAVPVQAPVQVPEGASSTVVCDFALALPHDPG